MQRHSTASEDNVRSQTVSDGVSNAAIIRGQIEAEDWWLYILIRHPWFELCVSSMIALSAVVMVVDAQVRGYELGASSNFGGSAPVAGIQRSKI